MSDYLREIKTAHIDRTHLSVELLDGATFTVPLALYPTLLLATDDERNAIEVAPYSLHWDSLDCDLGIEGLLQGTAEHPKLAEKAWARYRERCGYQSPDASIVHIRHYSSFRSIPNIWNQALAIEWGGQLT